MLLLKMLDSFFLLYYNTPMNYNNSFEFIHEQHTSYNKLHFFDKTPIDLAASEYGIQDFRFIIPAGLHTIEGYCLHYILKGKGSFQYANKHSVTCERGDVIITFPNTPIQFVPDAKMPWKYFYVMFNSPTALDLLSAAKFSHSRPVYKAKHTEEIEAIIENLSEHYTNPLTNKFRSIAALLEIFSYIIEEQNFTKSSQRVDKEIYIQKAFQIVERRYGDPEFRISEICSDLNISYPYLSQLFRELVGNSIISYLKNFRMREARVLLDQGERIGLVAEKCGYNSFSHFTKEFKEMFNITPSQYREEQRKTLRNNTPPPKRIKNSD